MTEDLHKSTQTLISSIEKKDRRFRVFGFLAVAITVLLLAVLLVIGLRNLTRANEQLTKTNALLEQQKQATDTITRRLDCMTVFFSQKDRTSLSIADIDKCTLDRSGDIQHFFVQPQTGQQSQPQTSNQTSPSQATPTTTQPVQEPSNPTPVNPVTPVVPVTPPLIQVGPLPPLPCIQLGQLKIC
jgi:Tfp pilus assembly protein PilN